MWSCSCDGSWCKSFVLTLPTHLYFLSSYGRETDKGRWPEIFLLLVYSSRGEVRQRPGTRNLIWALQCRLQGSKHLRHQPLISRKLDGKQHGLDLNQAPGMGCSSPRGWLLHWALSRDGSLRVRRDCKPESHVLSPTTKIFRLHRTEAKSTKHVKNRKISITREKGVAHRNMNAQVSPSKPCPNQTHAQALTPTSSEGSCMQSGALTTLTPARRK